MPNELVFPHLLGEPRAKYERLAGKAGNRHGTQVWPRVVIVTWLSFVETLMIYGTVKNGIMDKRQI